VEGLGLSDKQLDLLLTIDRDVWTEEAALIPPAYKKFGSRLPAGLWAEHAALVERLNGMGA
jgi:phosphoenolpyruvate carboxykinase (GTP)